MPTTGMESEIKRNGKRFRRMITGCSILTWAVLPWLAAHEMRDNVNGHYIHGFCV
jgi:hypothetical protein